MGIGTMMAGGGGKRLDFFPTPPEATIALLRAYRIEGQTIWEPAAGEGAMAEILRNGGGQGLGRNDVIASDEVEHPCLDFIHDFRNLRQVPKGVSAIITNPPFTLANAFIQRTYGLTVPFVAFLLKANFWNVKANYRLFHQVPPTGWHPLTWRLDFQGLGRPVMDTAWCVWDNSGAPPRGLQPFIRP